MDGNEMQPGHQAAPERQRKRGKRGAATTLAVVILCVCLALAFHFGSDFMSPLPDADAGPLPSCETDLSDELKSQGVPGLAAVIVKDGRIVCTAVAGMADIDEEIPVTQSTLFLVASISKTITGTALMQLYERGKFELDDEINDYLPFEISIPAAPDSAITFHHLLTHTASLKDNSAFFNTFTTFGADSPISLAELTEEYLTPDGEYYDKRGNFIDGPPGTAMNYSNMGIALAGYLVEQISGQPFDEYSRDQIFSRLAMYKTSWRLADIDQSELAVPYNRSWPSYIPLDHYGQANYPDGMLRTPPVELAHFLIAFMQGGSYEGKRILQRATVDEMLSSQTELNQSQGLVWFRASVDGQAVWGHDGSDDGASAGMWFDPEDDVGVILVANGNWKDESGIFEALFDEADEYD